MTQAKELAMSHRALGKCPTGIAGLDQITEGGLPEGRATLVCGSAGCGKTTLAMEFLLRGILEYGEPGVFMSFEENIVELTQNYASMGFAIEALREAEQLVIDHVHVERSEIEETGEYDLDGLFVRLGYAIDSVGAKRVVLDTIEALFAALPNEGILRAELRRLFRWLKDKGVTAVITGEKGEKTLTRHGLEEYVADCVIFLDHRVVEQLSTRRLRIVKYRGSSHGANEYPFLIGRKGISVLPVTSLSLNHDVSTERISMGVPRLDAMLGGGVYRGSSVLISGTAGTGKSSLAALFAAASCQRGERSVYFGFEESPRQIVRNMRSIGLDLEPWVTRGLLHFHNERATAHGLELHLLRLYELVEEFKPAAVVFDPLTNLMTQGTPADVRVMAMRLIDMLKTKGITGLFTSLTSGDHRSIEQSEMEFSSLIDTWMHLRDLEVGGERNRILHILKSRGTAHSNQVREFLITENGIDLVDVYLGPDGVLTGSARASQEARERTEAAVRRQQIAVKQKELERKRTALEAQMAALQASFAAEEEELRLELVQGELHETATTESRSEMARLRKADPAASLHTHGRAKDNGAE